jgi:hypothetical protein
MKQPDRRYTIIKIMLDAKKSPIKVFKDIFNHIPKSTVAGDLRTNNNRMHRLIENPVEFKISEIDTMARLFGCDPDRLIKLIRRQVKG